LPVLSFGPTLKTILVTVGSRRHLRLLTTRDQERDQEQDQELSYTEVNPAHPGASMGFEKLFGLLKSFY
jgi:hypothetical protein